MISDARLSDNWYAQPFNWVADPMGLVSADIGRRTWELLPKHFQAVGYRGLLLDSLYVAWG